MANVRSLTAVTDVRTGIAYLASALEQVLKMPWQRRQASVEFVDSPGAWNPRGKAAAPLQSRTIDVELTVVYDATTPHYTAAWNAFLAGPGAGRQVIMTFTEANGSQWFADARCVSADMQASTDYFSYCVIPASYFLASPFLYRPTPEQLADTGLLADSGLVADVANPTAALTSNSTAFSFTSTGVLTDEGTQVILNGPLTAPIAVTSGNLAVTNPANGAGRYFVYNLNIAAGESVTIDSGTGDVLSTVQGAAAYQSFVSDNVSESYFPVGPGTNPIIVTTGSAVGQNGRITIVYRPLTL